MADMEGFQRQLQSAVELASKGLGPAAVFVLGACYSKTAVEMQIVAGFIEEVETMRADGLLTEEVYSQVLYQIFLGALGTARDLLKQIKAKKIEEEENRCQLCGEIRENEATCCISRWCPHKFHPICAQRAIQQTISQSEGQEITCPAVDCIIQLTQEELLALYGSEASQELIQLLSRARPTTVTVNCPTFHCRTRVTWEKTQFFRCDKCNKSYCMHCLDVLTADSHECRQYDEESLSIAEMFANGVRFKVCEKCKYWCDLSSGGMVVCSCGEEICTVCEEAKKKCRCLKTLMKRPIEWLGSMIM